MDIVGGLPEGWVRVSLGDLCDLQAGPSGAVLQGADRADSGVPVVLPKDLRDGRVGETSMNVTLAASHSLARYALATGDILCTRTGEVGRCARVGAAQNGWLYATGLIRLRPLGPVDSSYLTHYLALPAVRGWVDRHTTGTAVPMVTVKTMGTLPVVVPPPAVQAAIGRTLDALEEKAAVHQQIAASTRDLRDTVAPLLISGAISAYEP